MITGNNIIWSIRLDRPDYLHVPNTWFRGNDVAAVVARSRGECYLATGLLERASHDLFPILGTKLISDHPIGSQFIGDFSPYGRCRFQQNPLLDFALWDNNAANGQLDRIGAIFEIVRNRD